MSDIYQESVKLVFRLTAAEKRAEQAEAALAAMQTPCQWRKRVGGWDTYCQNRSRFRNLQWKFCPYCAHPIEVQP